MEIIAKILSRFMIKCSQQFKKPYQKYNLKK